MNKPLKECYVSTRGALINTLDDELWRLGFSRRHRRQAERIAGATLDWYNRDGHASVAACDLSYGSVEAVKRTAISGVVVGLFMRLLAGWLIELVVPWIIEWLLSPQSESYRTTAALERGAA